MACSSAMVDASWSEAELAHALCDKLVLDGKLKAKPEFIRKDREAKIVTVFEGVNLDGAKMGTFDNPGPLEMLLRKATNGEIWTQQVIDGLVSMLPEDVAKQQKSMTMDEETREELAAAKEKSAQRRERLQEEGEEKRAGGGRDGERDFENGERGERGGDRGDKGKGGGYGKGRSDRDGDGKGRDGERGGGRFDRGDGGEREERGWGDSGRDRRPKGGDGEERGWGGGDRDRKPKGGGDEEGGKGEGKAKGKRRDRAAMECLNCKQMGHKSRDCPEPPDPELVRQRLAARAAPGGAEE